MGNVVLLDESTINKIAAGEVVDRPASIVKELVENSIDAKAKNITVEIVKGGIQKIRIVDDGCGIASDDTVIAFERHATSKIRQEEDIQKITSMGFRGEALASVAAIAKVTLETKTVDEATGTKVVIDKGVVNTVEEIPWTKGTTITVEDVFANVPARYKFLKKDYTEAGYIEDSLTRLALANPGIAIKYINNGKQIFSTTGNGDIKYTVYNIFGRQAMENLIEVNYEYENIKVTGVIGSPLISRSTRQHEFVYVNSRYIKDKTLMSAIERAFEQSLNIGKFPFTILNVQIPPNEIDVNVHPAKLEIKFENESKVFEAVYHAVKNGINNYHNSISPFANEASEQKIETTFEKEYVQETTVVKTVENNSTEESPIVEKQEQKVIEIESENNISNVQVDQTRPQQGFIYETNIEEEKVYITEDSSVQIQDILETKEEKETYQEVIKYKYVGSLFDTYILIEMNEKLYIIDQHAAHERMLYEEIKEQYYSKEKQTQMLLIPTLVELTNKEKTLITENMKMFEEAGYILEDFGDNAIKISGIPNIGYDINFEEMLKDLIDELLENVRTVREEKEKRFLATLACKAAVKGNMGLTKEEHITLLDKMMKLNNPFTCPHGRPTAYEVSKYEIERRFARK